RHPTQLLSRNVRRKVRGLVSLKSWLTPSRAAAAGRREEDRPMKPEHLTSQDFRTFAEGVLPRERARTAVAHLLRGCGTCRAAATPLWRPAASVAPIAPEAYDAVFERLAASL